MSSKSLELGDEAVTSPLKCIIKSQFFTTPRPAPAGTDLSGQVAIITGGNSGIGLHCGQHLLSLNLSRLIIAVRTPEKGEAVAAKLRTDYPSAKVDIWPLEMTSYTSIQEFARRAEELTRLDITILNAGTVQFQFGTCSTGHERTLQVNFLSTFLLAILMLPVCKAKSPSGSPGRLTIVSSGTALFAKLPNRDKRPLLASFDDISITPWDPTESYWSSKLLGHLLLIRMLDYLHADDVIVNLVEPGMCKGSGLFKDAPGPAAIVLSIILGLMARTLDDGAWAYIDAAVVKGKESHGCFCMDWKIHPFSRLAYLPEGALVMDALWEETMAEFQFAGAQEILEKMKRRENN